MGLNGIITERSDKISVCYLAANFKIYPFILNYNLILKLGYFNAFRRTPLKCKVYLPY